MRIIVGGLAVLYGAVATFLAFAPAFAGTLAFVATGERLVLLLALISIVEGTAAFFFFTGGIGILAEKKWGVGVTSIAGWVLVVSIYLFFSVGPGPLTERFALASLLASVPLFAALWCRHQSRLAARQFLDSVRKERPQSPQTAASSNDTSRQTQRIPFKCTHCGARVVAKSELAGRELTCPKCKNKLTVPTVLVAPPVQDREQFPELQLVAEPVHKKLQRPRKDTSFAWVTAGAVAIVALIVGSYILMLPGPPAIEQSPEDHTTPGDTPQLAQPDRATPPDVTKTEPNDERHQPVTNSEANPIDVQRFATMHGITSLEPKTARYTSNASNKWRKRVPVYRVAISQDGKAVAATFQRANEITVWDARSHAVLMELPVESSMVLAFSPDGKILAAGNRNHVNAWDVRTGDLKWKVNAHVHPSVYSIAFSPDGKTVAAGHSKLFLFDSDSGELRKEMTGNGSTVRGLAFSPDGRLLVAGSVDSTVTLWNVQRAAEVKTFEGHTGVVQAVAYAPDARRLASASWDHTVKIWDIETGQVLHTLKGHTKQVWSIAFSDGGKTLISASADETVRFWDAHTGALISQVDVGENMCSIALCGTTLVSGGFSGKVRLWQLDPVDPDQVATSESRIENARRDPVKYFERLLGDESIGGSKSDTDSASPKATKTEPSSADTHNPPKVTAVAAIKKLGGTVDTHGPGNPVRSVKLRGPKVTDAALVHVKGLTQVETLELSLSNVTDAGLVHLEPLTSLENLYLYRTHISDSGLFYLGDLTKLQFLDLRRTRVGDAGLGHLKALPGLKSLYLDDTKVTDTGMAHVRAMASLQTLDLGSGVTDAGLEHLRNLTNLHALNLRGNGVTDAGLTHLTGLTTLTSIGLIGTAVTDDGLIQLNDLPLTRMDLLSGKFTDRGLEHLRPFSRLVTLDLRGTRITDAGLVHLNAMTGLTTLLLSRTQVTDKGLANLTDLRALRALELRDTRVTNAGVEALQSALPNCTIYQ